MGNKMLTWNYVKKNLLRGWRTSRRDNDLVSEESILYNKLQEKKGLDDYVIEGKNGLLTLDFERLEELSIKEFRRIHLEENEKFIYNHVQQIGHKPKCVDCPRKIDLADDLIREHDGSSHLNCFMLKYNAELRETFPENEQKYFDRLILSLCNK